MAARFPSNRHQLALGSRTGYRRWSRFSFSRNGISADLEPTSGSFTQDARRNGRWDGRLTFAGLENLPTRPGDLLTPFGTTVSVELGLELLDGSISTVPYGTYEISSAQTDISAGSRTVTVGLIDMSDRVERYRFEAPFFVEGGHWLADQINIVVRNRTGFSANIPAGGEIVLYPMHFGLETGTGPWSELQDVANSLSQVIWYDRAGQVQMGSVSPTTNNAYPLDSLTSLSSDFDTRPANVVVARGEDTDGVPPVQAIAMDTDPGSATYAGTAPGTSPYGRTTEFFASPLIKTVAQAQSAAQTRLNGNIGAGATYTMVRPYDPTLDAGDVITFAGDAYVIDSITLDLTGDTTAKVRQL